VQEGAQQQLTSDNAAVAAVLREELPAYGFPRERKRPTTRPDNGEK
jgi:hypothetical protein